MRSLTSHFLSGLRFNGLQITTLRALGEYRGKQQLFVAQSPQILDDLKELAVIESTESSNRLEGVTRRSCQVEIFGKREHGSQEQIRAGDCRVPRRAVAHP